MRIIAGRFGGRPISAPVGRETRPTADRVREALFSMLGPLDGFEALDLFAGSGALGLEAISRGAKSVDFVDVSDSAIRTLERNIGSLGVVAAVHRRDALAFLAGAAQLGRSWDVVFVDPPYSSASRLPEALAERLRPVLREPAMVVTESDKRSPLQLGLPTFREREYGDTRIVIHLGG